MYDPLMVFHPDGDVDSVGLDEIRFNTDDLVGWWCADSLTLSAIRNGDRVGKLCDKSDNSNHLIQTNISRQPTYVYNAINGYPALRFSASSQQHIQTSSNYNPPCTVFTLSRYSGTNKKKVVTSVNNNWSLGHESGKNSVFNFNGYVLDDGDDGEEWGLYTAVIRGSGENTDVYKNFELLESNQNGVVGPNGIRFGGTTGNYSDCEVVEFIIFDSALSEEEIFEVHEYFLYKYLDQKTPRVSQSEFQTSYFSEVGPSNALVGYYTFDNNVKDLSGFLSNGIWHGTPSYQAGRINQAAKVDNTRYIYTTDTNNIFNNDVFTISCWIRPELFAPGINNVICGTNKNDEGWMLSLGLGSGSLRFWINGNWYGGNYNVPLNDWTHIGVTRGENNQLKIYVNGQIRNSAASVIPIANGNLYFGRGGSTYTNHYFYGLIDDFRYFEREFNEVDAESLYDVALSTRLINLNKYNGIFILGEFSEINI